jgi:hypothetical protein
MSVVPASEVARLVSLRVFRELSKMHVTAICEAPITYLQLGLFDEKIFSFCDERGL